MSDVTYHRVTLLVPRVGGELVPRKWAWEMIIDSPYPIIVDHDASDDAAVPRDELPESTQEFLRKDEE